MLNSVKKFGIATKDKLEVGGRNGPLPVDPNPKTVYMVFVAEGWDENTSLEGPDDEKIGHGLMDKMALVGNYGASGDYDAEEIVAINSALSPDFAKQSEKLHGQDIAGLVQAVIDAVGDNGKVDFFEGSQILGKVWALVNTGKGSGIVGSVTDWFKNRFK